jgi:hypothetical protein
VYIFLDCCSNGGDNLAGSCAAGRDRAVETRATRTSFYRSCVAKYFREQNCHDLRHRHEARRTRAGWTQSAVCCAVPFTPVPRRATSRHRLYIRRSGAGAPPPPLRFSFRNFFSFFSHPFLSPSGASLLCAGVSLGFLQQHGRGSDRRPSAESRAARNHEFGSCVGDCEFGPASATASSGLRRRVRSSYRGTGRLFAGGFTG